MKIFKGKIIGLKMAKTITVEVERILAHQLYKKRFKRSKKYHVHSEVEHKIGENISFIECPPISKSKRWIEKTNEVRKEKPASPKVSRGK